MAKFGKRDLLDLVGIVEINPKHEYKAARAARTGATAFAGANAMEKIIELPDEVIKAAQDATGVLDEREAVEKAVQGYAATRPRMDPGLKALLDLAGSDVIDPDYDYKSMRRSGHDDDH